MIVFIPKPGETAPFSLPFCGERKIDDSHVGVLSCGEKRMKTKKGEKEKWEEAREMERARERDR